MRIYKVLGVDEESKAFSAKHIEACKSEDGGWNGRSGRYTELLLVTASDWHIIMCSHVAFSVCCSRVRLPGVVA